MAAPTHLLDASAMLAWLHEEPGCDKVEAVLDQSVISAVNAAEVVHKLVSRGAEPAAAREILRQTLVPVVEFNEEIVGVMAGLSRLPREFGLSLGDRACLATAQAMSLLAYTADQRWQDLPVAGFELIR